MRSYLHAIRSISYIRSYVSYQHRIKSGVANTRNVGQKMYSYYEFHSKNRCAKLAAYYVLFSTYVLCQNSTAYAISTGLHVPF